MDGKRSGVTGWGQASALLGGLCWLVLLAAAPGGGTSTGAIERLLLLAVLVVAPLALTLVATPERTGRHSRPYRLARLVQPFAAALAAAAFFLPAGVPAALLTAGWLLFTILVALFGLVRLLPRGVVRADEACIDAALLSLPVGGLWLLLSRAGANPRGFGDTTVLLTAIHFHYTSFAAPILAGLAGRALPAGAPIVRWAFRFVAAGVIAATPLIAIGIAFSPALELVAVVWLVLSLLLLSLLVSLAIVPRVRGHAVRGLLLVSGAAVVVPMLAVGLNAAGAALGGPTVNAARMVGLHGAVNALGFVLCGLLAWAIVRPGSHLPALGIPFSALSASGHVGPTFFGRVGAVPAAAPPPRGMVDDLADYRRPDFAPERLHPHIRDFYERTVAYELRVRPAWRPGFRLAARAFKLVSARIGQLNFPLAAERREDVIDSAILPLDDTLDGRTNVRAWVRTYRGTGAAIYAAAYAAHSFEAQTYMNIAFPLPGGNLTSILRLEALPDRAGPSGVLLTTFHAPDAIGDEGVYFANRILPLRLPIDETIRVWPAGGGDDRARTGEPATAGATVLARHDMWLCGLRCLTLHYAIFPRGEAASPGGAGSGTRPEVGVPWQYGAPMVS